MIAALILCGCGPNPKQTAAKLAVQQDGESCDDRAMAIIRAGETCEGIVTALNEMVDRDPQCQRVFKTSNPAVTCAGVGTQPKRTP